LPVAASLSLKPAPTVTFFNGPTEVSAGQTVKIFWATSHASAVDIDNNVGQNLGPAGEKEVTVNQSITYTLTAKGDGGTSTKTLSISVKAAAARAPTVTSFKASPARIQQGDTTTLTWSTTDAQSVTIDNGVGTNAANGSRPVSPTQSTTYNLTASGPGGTLNFTTSVIVDAKSQPTQPAQPPVPNQPSSDDAAIAAALVRHSAAYATLLVGEVKKEWTGMSKEQEKVLKGTFSSVRGLLVQYDGCREPVVTGDTATITCTESMSYTADNKRVSRTFPVAITFKKLAGTWKVDTKVGK